jgi:hypothetical protein
MGFRYRRRLRNFPGFWANLSRSGISLSAGIRGFRASLGPKGHQETISALGTGLSYRTKGRPIGKLGRSSNAPRHPVTAIHVIYLFAIALVDLWILAHVH